MAVERLDLEQTEPRDILINEHWLRYQFIQPFIKDKTVLDIASGSGYGSDYLAKNGAKKVVGADIDLTSIEQAKRKYIADNLSYRQADALDLPFANQEFEVVVSLETIEHFTAEDQNKYLSELKRVLKPDGLLILSTPNADFSKHKNPWHLKELTKQEFGSLIGKYFQNYQMFEQGNALASFIKAGKNGHFSFSSDFESRYFIILASAHEVPKVQESIASLNPLALSVRENHPVMKLMGKVYYQLNKIKLFKKLFNSLSKMSK